MKPHIYLLSSWPDGGYTYETWVCVCSDSLNIQVGKGNSPRAAYIDWLAKRGGV
jgi:hypothetical protein